MGQQKTSSQHSALQKSLFSYDNDPHFAYVEGKQAPPQRTIEQFIMKMILKMKLTNEICLMSFIFIERLIKKGEVHLLAFNWRPIVYTAIMLAGKYWDDISFWNIDFVETMPQIYSLQALNQLESTFLALCGYELYVSEELYDQYYEAIITQTSGGKQLQPIQEILSS